MRYKTHHHQNKLIVRPDSPGFSPGGGIEDLLRKLAPLTWVDMCNARPAAVKQ